MSTKFLSYKGYDAEIEFDDAANEFHGRVIGIKDVIDFYGQTLADVELELRNSIDEYIEWCQEDEEEPDKTWSDKLTFRLMNEPRRWIIVAVNEWQNIHSWRNVHS